MCETSQNANVDDGLLKGSLLVHPWIHVASTWHMAYEGRRMRREKVDSI